MENQDFAHWAIIEVFGHEKYAGHVTTHTIGSASMLKLSVPDLEGEVKLPGFTKFINHSSVFSITPVAEEYAIEMAKRLKKHPIEGYEHQRVVTEMAQRASEQMTLKQMKVLLERKGLLEPTSEEVHGEVY